MEITKKHVIIGSAILAAVIIIIAIVKAITKENMTGATGSTGGASVNLLAVDSTGNLSVTNIVNQLENALRNVPTIISYTPFMLPNQTTTQYNINNIQSVKIPYDIQPGALIIVDVQLTIKSGDSGVLYPFRVSGDINGLQTAHRNIWGDDAYSIIGTTNTFKFYFTGYEFTGSSNTFNLKAASPSTSYSFFGAGENDWILVSMVILGLF